MPLAQPTPSSSVRWKLLLLGVFQSISAMVGLTLAPATKSATLTPYSNWSDRRWLAACSPSFSGGWLISATSLFSAASLRPCSTPLLKNRRLPSSARKTSASTTRSLLPRNSSA